MLKNVMPHNADSASAIAKEALRAAEDVEARARATFDALSQSEADLSLDESEIGRHVHATSVAETRLKVAESQRRKAEDALAAAVAAEIEASRIARYRNISDKIDAHQKKFDGEYVELAHKILRLLAMNSEIQDEIMAVNKDLPQGVEALPYFASVIDYRGFDSFYDELLFPDLDRRALWAEFLAFKKLAKQELELSVSRAA